MIGFALFSPLIISVSIFLFSVFIGLKGVIRTGITLFLLSILLMFGAFLDFNLVEKPYKIIIHFFKWIDISVVSLKWGFLTDSLTFMMFFVVVTISLFVHIYSIEYMGEDPGFKRFYLYISLFTFFMLILISSDNFLQMFIGWEGVGLCSYLLISFWFT